MRPIRDSDGRRGVIGTAPGRQHAAERDADAPTGVGRAATSSIAPTVTMWIGALATLVATAALYAWTAAPDITLVDSGELALAAYGGGVAHPPGFPLYVLLGGLFANLPIFSTPVRALNLMSALGGALTVALVFLVVERTLALTAAAGMRSPTHADAPAFPRVQRRTALAAALFAAATAATSRKLWFWSGLTEVYTLGLALMLAAWFAALLWAVRELSGDRPAPLGPLFASVVLAALALTNHHATGVLIAPPLLLLVWCVRPSLTTDPAFLGKAAALVAAALLLYLQVPLATAGDTGLGWGGVDSPTTLFRHVIGYQYRAQVAADAAATGASVARFVSALIMDSGPVAAVLLSAAAVSATLGRLESRRHDGKAATSELARAGGRAGTRLAPTLLAVALPTVLIVSNLALTTAYRVGAEDRSSYEVPAEIAWCVLAGVSLALLVQRFGARGRLALPALLLVASVAVNVTRNHGYADMSSEYSARRLVEETLAEVPNGALVFTTEWNFYAPYLYMRHVEGYRRDVNVVNLLLMRRFWYAAYIEREMPGLIAAQAGAFARFREQVDRFDRGEAYDDGEIAAAYLALIRAWVDARASGRAFVDFATLKQPQELEWILAYRPAPSGMLVGLAPADGSAAQTQTVAPKDAGNLAYLRSRLSPEGRPLPSPATIDPTFVRYWKVYATYLDAIEASLLYAATGSQAAGVNAMIDGYRSWFIDTDAAVRSALEKRSRMRPAG